jgi:hypothetical protein
LDGAVEDHKSSAACAGAISSVKIELMKCCGRLAEIEKEIKLVLEERLRLIEQS